MATRAQRIGQLGERIAATFLRARGCDVIDRNVYAGGGEIDLIVRDGPTVAAAEVRTTATGRNNVESVDDAKWEAVQRASASLGYRIGRIDIISVSLDTDGAQIRWLRGVE